MLRLILNKKKKESDLVIRVLFKIFATISIFLKNYILEICGKQDFGAIIPPVGCAQSLRMVWIPGYSGRLSWYFSWTAAGINLPPR